MFDLFAKKYFCVMFYVTYFKYFKQKDDKYLQCNSLTGTVCFGKLSEITYWSVQHGWEEIVANALHLILRLIRLIQILRLSQDRPLWIHTNDLTQQTYRIVIFI